jgi:S1-C subfamily serine protease
LAAFCLAGASVSAGEEGRYLAVFADGRRLAGDELSGWGAAPGSPRLGDVALDDPKRPLRWLLDRALQVWNPSASRDGYIEFVGGDRLTGQVTGSERGDPDSIDSAALLLRVRHAYNPDLPKDTKRDVARVFESAVRRVVWVAQPHRTFQPSTIFLRDGRRLKFMSIRWLPDGVKVLHEGGMRRIPLSELAQLHMPPRDPWKTYYRELAILDPPGGEVLFRVETTDGLILTCSSRRFRVRMGSGRKPRKSRRSRRPRTKPPPGGWPEQWRHLVQPAWSADAIWIPFDTIRMRTCFLPHELPLTRLFPDRVVQKSMTGFQWLWRRDQNVEGDRLMVAGRSVGGGLGVHAHNELTFTLPDFARSFRTRVALDSAAGRGGCARALVYFDSTKSKPLYRSDIIVGTGKLLDSGELKLPPARGQARRLILVADAAHADRPRGADPFDIRDTLDWIDPVLHIDRGQLRAAVVRFVQGAVPAWKGWEISLGDSRDVPISSRWDGRRFVHGLSAAGRRLTLTSRRRIGPKERWLKLRVRQVGPPVNAGRLEVRAEGRLMAYLPVCRAGYDSPYLIPLDAYRGKDIKLQIVYRPGDADEMIDWPTLALVDRKTSANWSVLRTISAVSQRGVKLAVQDDGSILAAPNVMDVMPTLDTYNIRAATDLPRVTAIRLEALTDSSLPRGGPGRAARVLLSNFRASTPPTRRKTFRGRYVRLSLPGRETILNMNEVQIFAPPPPEAELLTALRQPKTPENLIAPGHKIADVIAILKIRPRDRDLPQRTRLQSYLDAISLNLALGTKPTQSSTVYNCKASRAVNGNVWGDFTHTDQEQSPWWEVDLGVERAINRIVIWNRTGESEHRRMGGLVVSVMDSDRQVVWERRDIAAPVPMVELSDSDAQRLKIASSTESCMGLNRTSSKEGWSANRWSISTRFGESHAIEFTLARPFDARRGGLDIALEHARAYPYAISTFSYGPERLTHRNEQRVGTLGRFRLLATADPPPVRAESVPVVIEPFETYGSDNADASQALASPHAIFEDTGRFDPVASADRSKIKLVSDDRHAGAHAVRVAPGGEYRLALGRIISIRAKPIGGEFRYIRFAFRKYGSGQIALSLGHVGSPARPCRYEAGIGTPTAPAAQSVWAIDLPPEWIVLDRDIFGDFGRLDLTAFGVACSGGSHVVLDHVYLARTPADFKRLPPAPTPAEANLKARRVLAAPIQKKGFPAVVSVTVAGRQATGVIVGDEGYVMTVAHVLVGAGPDASIRLSDGRTVKGKIAGVYRSADVGLIKITDKGPWKGLEISKNDTHARGGLYVGFTFARSFKGGKSPTSYITDIYESGYWTYRGRFAQKDAILGGPLLNENGRIVGVHNQMVDQGGMQFSRMRSPLHEWRRLKKGDIFGQWLSGNGPMMGFYSAVRHGGCGIARVYSGSPAAAAGMKPGDLITHVDDHRINRFEDMGRALADKDPGDEVNVVFKRGTRTYRKKIRLMRRK